MFNTFLSPIWDSWFSDFLSDPFLAYVDAVRKKEKKEDPPKFDTVEKDDKFIVYVKKDEGEMKDFVNDERMLVVTFTTVDGNETTINKVKVYIPNKYSTNFIKTIDGYHFKYEFEKECNCEKEHKCCEDKCCCTKKHDGLERTLKWMEDELEEAIEIGDDDLKKYLSEQIKVLKSILGKKNKTKEIRCGNKRMSLDEQCRISRN